MSDENNMNPVDTSATTTDTPVVEATEEETTAPAPEAAVAEGEATPEESEEAAA